MADHREEDDLYQILEVSRNASFDEIDKAYDRIMDFLGVASLATYTMVGEGDSHEQRDKVERAYRVLSDPDRRAAYDQSASGGYPDVVVVPESRGDASVTVGRVTSMAAPMPRNAEDDVGAEPPREPPAAMRAPPERITQEIKPVAVAVAPQPPLSATRRLQSAAGHLPQLTAEAETSGALLKRLRESVGATLEEVSTITKIHQRYLRAVEENDFDALPAQVYVRGFVFEYARTLGLEANQFAKGYMSLYLRYRKEGQSR